MLCKKSFTPARWNFNIASLMGFKISQNFLKDSLLIFLKGSSSTVSMPAAASFEIVISTLSLCF